LKVSGVQAGIQSTAPLLLLSGRTDAVLLMSARDNISSCEVAPSFTHRIITACGKISASAETGIYLPNPVSGSKSSSASQSETIKDESLKPSSSSGNLKSVTGHALMGRREPALTRDCTTLLGWIVSFRTRSVI
jgi:hypothetical protein